MGTSLTRLLAIAAAGVVLASSGCSTPSGTSHTASTTEPVSIPAEPATEGAPASAPAADSDQGNSDQGNSNVPLTIEGKWKSVGDTGWGQAQPGAIVIFNGTEANLYSPRDTYALEKTSSGYLLTVTGLMGGSTTFSVKVVDANNIALYSSKGSAPDVVLRRVS